jgi:hypothetical protein
MQNSCTIVGWSIAAAGSSPTCTIDIWNRSAGTSLPTVANTITGSAKPQLSTGNVVSSTTLTGWSTAVVAGDIIGYYLDACSNATKITLTLKTSVP